MRGRDFFGQRADEFACAVQFQKAHFLFQTVDGQRLFGDDLVQVFQRAVEIRDKHFQSDKAFFGFNIGHGQISFYPLL